TPLDAIRMATLNPAGFLGAVDSLGTIAPNKIADLLLLDADPLVDIRNTTRINAVVANGRLYDRTSLDGILSAAEKFAATTAPPR
ncbi:MAG: amidohydrolase family protein, partial [Gemmatimonadaceae bacterium]